MEQNDVGLQCETTGGNAADLGDGVTRETLVVLIRHGSGLLRADEVNGVAARLEVGQQPLTVTIRAAAVDVTPGDGVA